MVALLMSMGLGRSTLPMKMYSRRGNAKDEHEAKLAVLRAIDALKIQARKPSC
jgi:hypothetical protein